MRSFDLAKRLALRDVLLTYYEDMQGLDEEEFFSKQERMENEQQILEEAVERINKVFDV